MAMGIPSDPCVAELILVLESKMDPISSVVLTEVSPKIHEVWNYGEESVTPKVHLTARVSVGTFVGNVLLSIMLLQFGVGSLCLAGILLMGELSGPEFLSS